MEKPVAIYEVTKSIYDKKPSSENVLITCQPFEKIGQVLNRMEKKGLISLPVVDITTQSLIATVSVYDILTYFMTGKGAQNFAKPIIKVLECLTTSAGTHKSERAQAVLIPYPLSRVLTLEALLDPFSSGMHRILVEIKSSDGVTRHIRNISQTDILRYVYENQNLLPNELVISNLHRIKAVTHNVVTCYTTDNVLSAYKKIDRLYMSALAVIDPDNGELISTLSGSDLRFLTHDILSKMCDMTVKEFLTSERRGPMRKPITIDEYNNGILHAISRMLLSRTHRLWVVDDFKKPYGVISMSDIFRVLARRPPHENPNRAEDGTPLVSLHKLQRWATQKKEGEVNQENWKPSVDSTKQDKSTSQTEQTKVAQTHEKSEGKNEEGTSESAAKGKSPVEGKNFSKEFKTPEVSTTSPEARVNV